MPYARHSGIALLMLEIVNRPCFQVVHSKAGMTFQADNDMSRLSAKIGVSVRRGFHYYETLLENSTSDM